MDAYEHATLDECRRAVEKMPIGFQCIVVNNGDSLRTNYGSRLVATELNVGIRSDLFAATPPTECLRMLRSRKAENENQKVFLVGVSRAYLYAKAARPILLVLQLCRRL